MKGNLIPAYESTPGYTELYLAVESLTGNYMEHAAAMEGFVSKIGNFALKNLAKALNDSITVYHRWYSNATNAVGKYFNQVNHTNRTEITRLTQAIKMEKRQMDDLKRQAKQKNLSPEDRAEFLNEVERLKLDVERLVARNFELIDNIYIPNKVSDLYKIAMDDMHAYETLIKNYAEIYKALVDKEDDLNNHHYDWGADDYADEMRKLRNKTDKLQSDLMRAHNSVYGMMKMVSAYRYVDGDEITKYPIQEFLKLSKTLLWVREQTTLLEQRSRKHIQTVNKWMRDPKSIDMDDYQRITDELYIFIAMREICAQYLKIYMELMLRVLMKAQMPEDDAGASIIPSPYSQ